MPTPMSYEEAVLRIEARGLHERLTAVQRAGLGASVTLAAVEGATGIERLLDAEAIFVVALDGVVTTPVRSPEARRAELRVVEGNEE